MSNAIQRLSKGQNLPKKLNQRGTDFEKIENDYSKTLTQEAFIIHAEDDPWVTKKGMESLMNKGYPNLKKTYREVKVSESPKREIGHINFFRSFNKILWNIVLDEL